MGPHVVRRSRALDSDDEDSRPNTPASTAPNDSKRIRRTVNTDSEEEDDDGEDESLPADEAGTQATASRLTFAQSQLANNANVARQSSHQPGAIVRVKLTNFVTYTSAEFFPGPNLNMVIGPNGTGKSTLVCAICLGLGWGPQHLGRAKDPGEFVKHGCREATIEIELQRAPEFRKNPVITRIIKREGNKSTFLLNGGPSGQRGARTLAEQYNIQIDNLCQFLPQDKVVEFAQMSPIDLLASTQRAVAGPKMTKYHNDLQVLRNSQKNFMKENKDDREQLANLENRQEMQRAEVERMRERAQVKKRLERLEMCRPLVHYYEAKTNYLDAKQKSKDITRELKQLKTASAPTLRRLDSKQDYEKRAQIFKNKCEKELTAGARECENKAKAIADSQETMNEIDNKIEAEKKGIPKNREEMHREKGKLQDLRRKKAVAPPEVDSRAMNDEIQELRNRQRAVEREKNEMESRQTGLRDQGNTRKKELANLKSQLEGLETQAGQQDSKLEKLSRETFKAWKWVQENQDSFSQHVYGPPIVECSLKDAQMADAVESLLQESDFKIFTVQNKADFSLLQRKLFQEMKLHDISLRECSNANLDQFRSPLTPEEMGRFGLSGWVLDQLQGPETVLAMLCHERSLHRSAISSRDLSQQQHDDLAKTTVQSYVAGRKTYQFLRRAEYGAAGTSARVRDVRPARMWTDQPVDMGRQAALQRQMSETRGEAMIIKTEFDGLKSRIVELDAEATQLGQEIEEKKQAKEAKQRALMEWKALDPKIQICEDNIGRLQEALGGVRARVAELKAGYEAALLDKTEAVIQFAAATREYKLRTAAALRGEVIHIEAQSDFEVLKAENDHLVQTIGQKETEQATATEFCRKEHARAKALMETSVNLQKESEKIAQEEGDRSFIELLEYVGESVKTEENLEAELDAERAKLELTEGGSAHVVKDYEDRAKVIDKLRARVRTADVRQADFRHGIGEIRSKWEPELEAMVAKINDAFSDSFARIGCAGQVAVHKASSDDPVDCSEENGGTENGLDFGNWAIHISVKFREREPLSLLDSHRQSGGERAVSTIFYLMALQSLSRAPFRVVDEINQGMDPRNERMVHGRMVDIAAEEGGSQYFLITPKLLSGLKYRRGMTVLCIVSGENMPAARERDDEGKWHDGPKVDFRQFVKRANELGFATGSTGRAVNEGGKRIDSGVGMGGGRLGLVGA